jgi:hypothetical protein
MADGTDWRAVGAKKGGIKRGGCGSSGAGTRLDRHDHRLQRHEGRVVRTAGPAVVLAGAVGVQDCVFLVSAVFVPAVPRVPAVSAGQPTPVDLPVGVALDEGRVPAGERVHADARGAVGDFARIDSAVTIGEDAVVALGGADVRRPPELDFRHAPLSYLRTPAGAPNRIMGAHESRIPMQMLAGEGAHLGWRMPQSTPTLSREFNWLSQLVLLFVPWGYPQTPKVLARPRMPTPARGPQTTPRAAHLSEKYRAFPPRRQVHSHPRALPSPAQ